MAGEDNQLVREAEASRIVKGYIGWTAGAGLIPLPWVDLVAITAIQVKMVADLAALYNVPFSRNIVKSIIAALLGSVIPGGLTKATSSLIKSIPVVGTTVGLFTMPIFASASTYAVGRVFIQHFEAGGNLLSFDVEGMRQHFKAEFEEASASEAENEEDLAKAS